MSDYVTLQEVTDLVEPLVVTTNFTGLANRAAKRLYSKGATPGMTVEWMVTDVGFPLFIPGEAGEDGVVHYPDEVIAIPLRFASALFFIYKGSRRYVIPLESKHDPSGYDTKAFIDYGEHGEDRIYQLPFDYCEGVNITLDDDVLYAVLKKAYVDAVDPADAFPFKNASAIKLAILATVYEDENDLERSKLYWSEALAELESDSQLFRGPQKMTVSVFDAAAYESLESIN